MSQRTDIPKVLCLSGHDPSGGAGLQADIETVAALGGHAVGVITAYTIQDTRNVLKVSSPPLAWFRRQLAVVLDDIPVAAIKIGLLGDPAQVPVIAKAIRAAGVPVVLDPVLRAGGGRNLSNLKLMAAMRRHLLPWVDVATPNQAEALRLLPGPGALEAVGLRWLASGTRNVLITGGDTPCPAVSNIWFRHGATPRRYAWPRLAGGFHGAGCTLASAIATLLASGLPMAAAIQDAQSYVHRSLQQAQRIGRGRAIPGRWSARP